MCPAAIDYFAEAVRADVHTDANEIMSRVARGDWARISSMATICSGEARYTDEVRKLLTLEITMSMLAWDDAKRPRPPDERDELSHPSGR